MTKEPRWLELQPYLRREPVTLALLTGLAIVLFAAVSGLSRLYDGQQRALAERWSARGAADLAAKRFAAAVTDFRTSLLYSRDNFDYQLNLAESLLGEKRIDEAQAYLRNLWDLQPENGLVNLELARIAAGKGQIQEALRYYNDAIYAVWPGDQETERRNTRLELIHLLLRINAQQQAQSELIALAANLGDNAAEEAQAGALFMQAQDYTQALNEFRLSLRNDRHNVAAMTGAGEAAFKLGQYETAERYLAEAVRAAPGDKATAARLKTAALVLQLDPFGQRLASAERDRRVVADFTTAGARLSFCMAPGNPYAAAAPQQGLLQQWTKLKPQITVDSLRRDPDLVNTAMDLVFAIERQTGSTCGVPSDADTALLLVANLHEGL